MTEKTAIIAGAGPAGLTAAYELLHRTDIKPIVYEIDSHVGGISKTVNCNGNRMDIGGHRFFSKSDRIMNWWLNILPLQGKPSRDETIPGGNGWVSHHPHGPDPEKTDPVMLVRRRLSKILFQRKLFDYPIAVNANTVMNLGLGKTARIGASYIKARLFPIAHERSLADFLTNRFGSELYQAFFRDYTEKIWGVPPDKIDPKWGYQRIKRLSLGKAVLHFIRERFLNEPPISQKQTETSLVGRFLYPKLGPGQLWEKVAEIIEAKGGKIHFRHKITGFRQENHRITAAKVLNTVTGRETFETGAYFFSTMPVSELIGSFSGAVPSKVRQVAGGLTYRGFITVGLLVKKLRANGRTASGPGGGSVSDNWIYIQEDDVRLGRIQVFNNWSPYLVTDPDTTFIGLEYFCNEGDELWRQSDDAFAAFAVEELATLNLVDKADVMDHTVIRVPKAYPNYFGAYAEFDIVRTYLDQFVNLFLCGRNGMHRYNNQDHSMLSAMAAVENIIGRVTSKDNIWNVNTEDAYNG